MPYMMWVSIICKEQGGWTFQQFLDQPEDLIHAITARMAVENDIQKKKNEEMERNANSRH